MCPQPSQSDVHVDRPLTEISVAYIQSTDKYVADKVFPVLPVNKQSDRYFVYDRGDWLRDEAEERAASSESAGSGWALDNTPSYYAPVVALHKDIDDQIRDNSDAPLDMDRDATEFCTQKMLIKRDKMFASAYFKTGIWTGSTTGSDITPSTPWDAPGSDPVDDIQEQQERSGELTTYLPNVLLITAQVFRAFKSNAAILDRIKYTERGIVTEDLLASIFGVDKVVVARSTNNVGAKGAADSMQFIFSGAQALLVYAAPRPALLQPTGGYIFAWKGFSGSNLGWRVKRFRMEWTSSDRVEVEAAWAMKLVAPDTGVFFNNVLS